MTDAFDRRQGDIVVPQLAGMSLEEAILLAEHLCLVLTRPDIDAPVYTVYPRRTGGRWVESQHPPAGTRVAAEASIRITVRREGRGARVRAGAPSL